MEKGFSKYSPSKESRKLIEKALSTEYKDTARLIPESAGKGSMALQHFLYGDPNFMNEFSEKKIKEYHNKRILNLKKGIFNVNTNT